MPDPRCCLCGNPRALTKEPCRIRSGAESAGGGLNELAYESRLERPRTRRNESGTDLHARLSLFNRKPGPPGLVPKHAPSTELEQRNTRAETASVQASNQAVPSTRASRGHTRRRIRLASARSTKERAGSRRVEARHSSGLSRDGASGAINRPGGARRLCAPPCLLIMRALPPGDQR